MDIFKQGTVLSDTEGRPIKVLSYIGGGAQGDVYKVGYQNREMALKWYKPGKLTGNKKFYENLEKNVRRGSPDPAFLWPCAITAPMEGSYGYIMELVPEGYVELSEILVSRGGGGFVTFKAAVEACIHIVSAFRILHNMGYSYQDMNDGNFFIHPGTGDVKICDNDNAAPNETHTGIIGTPRYMAPEIVANSLRFRNYDQMEEGERQKLEKYLPNTHTDEFSMSVILFLILCASHPLEGERWLNARCMTDEYERALYGTGAVFIFDPEDRSNRPVKECHGNVLKRWKYLPDYMQEIFTRAFSGTALLQDPCRRVKDVEWLKVLTRFQSDIVRCPHCKNEIFLQNSAGTICECCQKLYEVNNTLKLREYAIPAVPKARIYRCQVEICNPDEAMQLVGVIIPRPDRPQELYFRNMTSTTAEGFSVSGVRHLLNPGDLVPVRAGIQINILNGKIVME